MSDKTMLDYLIGQPAKSYLYNVGSALNSDWKDAEILRNIRLLYKQWFNENHNPIVWLDKYAKEKNNE